MAVDGWLGIQVHSFGMFLDEWVMGKGYQETL